MTRCLAVPAAHAELPAWLVKSHLACQSFVLLSSLCLLLAGRPGYPLAQLLNLAARL